MPERRCSGLFWVGGPTVAATGACLLYGAVLSTKGGNASLTMFNWGRLTGSTAAVRKIVLRSGAATGSVVWNPPAPMEMSSGLFATMTAGHYGMMLYSKRN